MKQAKKKIAFETVKLKKGIVDRVRANKDLTGVSISAFFEMAADEKLMSAVNKYARKNK